MSSSTTRKVVRKNGDAYYIVVMHGEVTDNCAPQVLPRFDDEVIDLTSDDDNQEKFDDVKHDDKNHDENDATRHADGNKEGDDAITKDALLQFCDSLYDDEFEQHLQTFT